MHSAFYNSSNIETHSFRIQCLCTQKPQSKHEHMSSKKEWDVNCVFSIVIHISMLNHAI